MPQKRTLDDLDDAQKGLEYRVTGLENKLKLLLGGTGLTLVLIVGATYWLGRTLATVDATVQTSSARVNTVYQVVLENKDSLATRTSLIESKLNMIDTKLDELVKFREKTSVTIRRAPEPKPTP